MALETLSCKQISPCNPEIGRYLCCALSRVRHFGIQWPVASQAALSMGLPRQEGWSELPFPSPGDLPDPGIKLVFLTSLALAGRFTTEPPGKPVLALPELI